MSQFVKLISATYLAIASAVVGNVAFAQKPIPIAAVTRSTPVRFEAEILPLLQKNCLACHSTTEANGDLVLETPAAMLKGGDSGPAIVIGKGSDSLLVKAAAHSVEPYMPPPGNDVAATNLTSAHLGLIKLWIDQGAKISQLAGAAAPKNWRSLPPGDHPIYAVALSPDGQFVSCGRANQIFIYHAQTGQLVTRLTDPALVAGVGKAQSGVAHLDVVQSLAFSKQGDRLASGGFRTAKIWRNPRNVQRLKLAPSASAGSAVAVSHDRELIATGNADHSIQIWNVGTGEKTFSLAGHTEQVCDLCFSHDDTRLYSASLDQSIRIWEVANGTGIGTIVTPEPVHALATVQQPPAAPPTVPSVDSVATIDPTTQSVDELLVSAGGKSLRLWKTEEPSPETVPITLKKSAMMAVNHDRRFVAIASAAGNVEIIDLKLDKTIQTWTSGVTAPQAIAFSHARVAPAETEGEASIPNHPLQLVIAGETGRIEVWNVGAESPEVILQGSSFPVTAIVFQPDGLALSAGNDQGEITRWMLPPSPRTLAENTPTVAVSSRDGKLLAVAETSTGQPAIVIYDTETGAAQATLRGHTEPITALAFNAVGSQIASGSEDFTVKVWSWREGKYPQIATFAGHTATVRGVAFNGDGTKVLSGGDDKTVMLWPVAGDSEPIQFAGHTAGVVSVAMLGGNQPASASVDKTVRIWNPADGKLVRTIPTATPISAMSATSDGARLIIAEATTAGVYQASDGKQIASLTGLAAGMKTVCISGDDERLLVSAATEAALFRLSDGRLLERLAVESNLAASALNASGETIFLSSDIGLIARRTAFIQSLDLPGSRVNSLIYRKDSAVLFSASADGSVVGHTLQSGQPLFSAKQPSAINDLAISPDESTLAAAGEDQTIRILLATTGAASAPGSMGPLTSSVRTVCFSGDGTKLIAATKGDAAEVAAFHRVDGAKEQTLFTQPILDLAAVDEETGQVICLTGDSTLVRSWLIHQKRFDGHTADVTSLAAVADMQVLSGGIDGTLRHWNLAAATPLVRQMNHGAPINAVAAHSEAGRFASVSENKTVRLWNAANGQQLAEMGGDLHAKQLVANTNLRKNDWNAKIAAAKLKLDAAQKDVPIKTAAEKAAATALAAAEADMQAKKAATTQAETAKTAAEKAAITASIVAQTASSKQLAAELATMNAATKLARLTEAATRAKATLTADSTNTVLTKIAADADAAVVAADAEHKAAQAAQAAPTQAATVSATAANVAAQNVVAVAKTYNDAAAALVISQTAYKAALQTHRFAKDDLTNATAAVPVATAEVTQAEKALADVEVDLAKAIEQELAAYQPLQAVRFSPDGRVLATAGDSGVVHTWGAVAGKEISSFVGHANSVAAIAFVTNDELVSVSADQSTILWSVNPDWELERVIGDINNPTLLADRVVSVDFSHDGKLLATGGGVPSREGEVKIWKVADGDALHSWPNAHTDGVNSVAFSADDALLASASADKMLRSWNVETGEATGQFEGHTGHALGVSWRANGQTLASCGGDATIRIWNAQTGDRIRAIVGYNKQINAVKFVGQTQFVVSASGEGIVRMHNTDNGGVVRTYSGSEDYMYAVDATPDSSLVVAGGHQGVLRIWNGANGQVLQAIKAPRPATDEEPAAEDAE